MVEGDAGSFLAWKDGRLLFAGNTLEQVMRQLARWYDMDYTFADERAKSMVLRGKMPIQTNISEIFEIFETSGRVKFLVDNNRVTIQTLK
jgi:ferric-dicitrate binding protein FerR (iron transport regulator)